MWNIILQILFGPKVARIPQTGIACSPLHLVPHLLAALEKIHGGLGARLQEVHDHILLQQLHAKVRRRARVVLELRRYSSGFQDYSFKFWSNAELYHSGSITGMVIGQACSRNLGQPYWPALDFCQIHLWRYIPVRAAWCFLRPIDSCDWSESCENWKDVWRVSLPSLPYFLLMPANRTLLSSPLPVPALLPSVLFRIDCVM